MVAVVVTVAVATVAAAATVVAAAMVVAVEAATVNRAAMEDKAPTAVVAEAMDNSKAVDMVAKARKLNSHHKIPAAMLAVPVVATVNPMKLLRKVKSAMTINQFS